MRLTLIMSQQMARGNPNLGRKVNAPTLVVKNSTLLTNAPTQVANIPNSAAITTPTPMSSNPATTLPTALAIAAIPRSSSLIDAQMEVVEREDFGRDKDLKTLIKHLQREAFKGEGTDIPKILEEWIISMDDYFALANYNSIA